MAHIDDSIIIVPLRRYYQAAKAALAELEAIPADAVPVDWPYVKHWKEQIGADIRELDSRFPGFIDNEEVEVKETGDLSTYFGRTIGADAAEGLLRVSDPELRPVFTDLARRFLADHFGIEVKSIRCNPRDVDYWECVTTDAETEPCLVYIDIEGDTYKMATYGLEPQRDGDSPE